MIDNIAGETKIEADMEAIFLLLNLRDIRKRYNLDFNITMEMQNISFIMKQEIKVGLIKMIINIINM